MVHDDSPLVVVGAFLQPLQAQIAARTPLLWQSLWRARCLLVLCREIGSAESVSAASADVGLYLEV